MVKRYDLWIYYDEWQEDESNEGEWVKYEDHAAELAILRAENERMRDALREIGDRHIPSEPATYGGSEYDWVVRQYAAIRAIAKEALK